MKKLMEYAQVTFQISAAFMFVMFGAAAGVWIITVMSGWPVE